MNKIEPPWVENRRINKLELSGDYANAKRLEVYYRKRSACEFIEITAEQNKR